MNPLLVPLFAALFPVQAAPAPSVSPPPTRPTREERLAAQKLELQAEIAKIDAFGHVDEFRAALEELEKKHGEVESGEERWAPCSDGWLPMMAVDHWLAWHLPAKGRTLPVAIDVELPNHPFATIVDLARQLREHDIEFLLAVFPSRVQLHPELVLPELATPEAERLRSSFRGMVGATTRFLLALNEKGVETVDLAPVFVAAREAKSEGTTNHGLYLVRNKHWTPRAAELAAKVVAERLRAMAWFTEGASKEGSDFSVMARVQPFSSAAGGQSPDHTPEQLAFNQVRQLGKPVNPADARRSPVVVLGDSFARFFTEGGASASFVDQLRRFTGWPIDAITPTGGGELQCREQLARRHDQLRGKQVVIWLLQEDNLRLAQEYRAVDLFAE